MKPSEIILKAYEDGTQKDVSATIEVIIPVVIGLANALGVTRIILDEMREQLDELQAWRNSVKDQLL